MKFKKQIFSSPLSWWTLASTSGSGWSCCFLKDQKLFFLKDEKMCFFGFFGVSPVFVHTMIICAKEVGCKTMTCVNEVPCIFPILPFCKPCQVFRLVLVPENYHNYQRFVILKLFITTIVTISNPHIEVDKTYLLNHRITRSISTFSLSLPNISYNPRTSSSRELAKFTLLHSS